jgi:cysteine-rich repeat protein
MHIYIFKLFLLIAFLIFNLSCDQIITNTKSNDSTSAVLAALAQIINIQQASANSSYPTTTSFTYIAGQIINIKPSSPVTGATYSISPTLPSGITLDQNTGVLSGTSTINLSSTTFSITQTRPDGEKTVWTIMLEITGGTSPTTTTTTPITNHTVGGSISGNLNSGTVVLRLNGANNLSRSATGTFVFGNTISTNNSYAVTILTQPSTGSTCGVTANGSGTIVSSNVTNVLVECTLCGDGNKPSFEACDDGNASNGDGCTSSCTVESGFTCTGSPSICSN